MRTSPLILPAIVLALALGACGGDEPGTGDTAEPTPSVTTTDTPAPEADPTVARVHVGLNHVLIFDTEGVSVADFTLYQPAAEVVPILTAAFGADPVVSDRAGGLESPPSRLYDWSGFTVVDGERLTIMGTDLILDVATASVGDVQVYTYLDVQVGTPMADVIAVQDDGFAFPDFTVAHLGTQPVDPVSVGEAPGMDLAMFVAVYGPAGGTGNVTNFIAPSPNWGV